MAGTGPKSALEVVRVGAHADPRDVCWLCYQPSPPHRSLGGGTVRGSQPTVLCIALLALPLHCIGVRVALWRSDAEGQVMEGKRRKGKGRERTWDEGK